jgi:hypothetical protein
MFIFLYEHIIIQDDSLILIFGLAVSSINENS